MTTLIWVRTRRHIDTLAPEIDQLRLEICQYGERAGDAVEPFVGDDHLLFGVDSKTNLHSLKAFLAPALGADFIIDWSATEVGTGIARAGYDTYEEDGRLYFDERYLVSGDDDERYYYEEIDDTQVAMTAAAHEKGFARLRWRMYGPANGATILWIDLHRERADIDPLLRRIERLLPTPTKHIWHGRSSMAFGYVSQHDTRQPSPFGISPEILELLEADEVADFLAFQVGTQSVGPIENMNQIKDFIWSIGRRQHGDHSRPSARKKEAAQPRPEVVVVRSTRGRGRRP